MFYWWLSHNIFEWLNHIRFLNYIRLFLHISFLWCILYYLFFIFWSYTVFWLCNTNSKLLFFINWVLWRLLLIILLLFFLRKFFKKLFLWLFKLGCVLFWYWNFRIALFIFCYWLDLLFFLWFLFNRMGKSTLSLQTFFLIL